MANFISCSVGFNLTRSSGIKILQPCQKVPLVPFSLQTTNTEENETLMKRDLLETYLNIQYNM